MKRMVVFVFAGGLTLNAVATSINVDNIDEIETSAAGRFDGLCIGASVGGSFLGNRLGAKLAPTDPRYSDDKMEGDISVLDVNRVSGNISIGYGKSGNGKFYVGGELLLEFTKNNLSGIKANTSERELNEMTESWKIKSSNFTPELTLKGGYIRGTDMFYIKTGIAKPKASCLVSEDVTGKFSEVLPIVYIGATRTFPNKWSANIELGYQYSKKEAEGEVDGGRMTGGLKINQGWKMRAGIAHTFGL